jgi:hypothetical protein
MSYSIGYWANTKRWTQTHIRNDETGQPVCGCKISMTRDILNDNSETAPKRFQWCAHGYTQWDYLECEHCKNWYRRLLAEEVKKTR